MRQFLADASHDLRTPLAGVIAGAEQLLRHPTGRSEREDRLVQVIRQARRAARLVDDLLLMTRLDAAAQSGGAAPQAQHRPVDPVDVIAREIELLQLRRPDLDVQHRGDRGPAGRGLRRSRSTTASAGQSAGECGRRDPAGRTHRRHPVARRRSAAHPGHRYRLWRSRFRARADLRPVRPALVIAAGCRFGSRPAHLPHHRPSERRRSTLPSMGGRGLFRAVLAGSRAKWSCAELCVRLARYSSTRFGSGTGSGQRSSMASSRSSSRCTRRRTSSSIRPRSRSLI